MKNNISIIFYEPLFLFAYCSIEFLHFGVVKSITCFLGKFCQEYPFFFRTHMHSKYKTSRCEKVTSLSVMGFNIGQGYTLIFGFIPFQ